jgi:2-dehydropantoate 2-reductase
MQFAVIGAGNIGCIYGANLARIGEPVVMLDVWQEHVDAMRSHGLRMDGLHGEFSAAVTATSIPAEAPKADVALICVNSYSTAAAAQSAKELLKPSGAAVTLQNGLGNLEILAETLGSERVMAGLTFHSADLHAPGRVTHNLEGPTYLGEIGGMRSPRLEAMSALLERAGLHPVFTPDVVAMMWQKFVYNCAINALCALTSPTARLTIAMSTSTSTTMDAGISAASDSERRYTSVTYIADPKSVARMPPAAGSNRKAIVTTTT